MLVLHTGKIIQSRQCTNIRDIKFSFRTFEMDEFMNFPINIHRKLGWKIRWEFVIHFRINLVFDLLVFARRNERRSEETKLLVRRETSF